MSVTFSRRCATMFICLFPDKFWTVWRTSIETGIIIMPLDVFHLCAFLFPISSHDLLNFCSGNSIATLNVTVWNFVWQFILKHHAIFVNSHLYKCKKGKVFPMLQLSGTPWRRNGGVEIQLHAFLTAALDRDEWSASRAGRFTPGERSPGTH
jgi:hypothetical protein